MDRTISSSHEQTVVLVTGRCGFLGSHIVDAFVSTAKYRIVALSRNPNVNLTPKAEYIACDADDLTSVIESVRPNIIIHTITPGPFAPAHSHCKDLDTTHELVNIAARAASVRAFIYSGSIEGIANVSGARQQPLREDQAVLHNINTAPSAYACTKACTADIVLKANSNALRTAVFYLPGMYGPRDRQITMSIWDMRNTFMTRVQLGNNEVVHDWLYVENAAYAHLLGTEALLRPTKTSGRGDGQASSSLMELQ